MSPRNAPGSVGASGSALAALDSRAGGLPFDAEIDQPGRVAWPEELEGVDERQVPHVQDGAAPVHLEVDRGLAEVKRPEQPDGRMPPLKSCSCDPDLGSNGDSYQGEGSVPDRAVAPWSARSISSCCRGARPAPWSAPDAHAPPVTRSVRTRRQSPPASDRPTPVPSAGCSPAGPVVHPRRKHNCRHAVLALGVSRRPNAALPPPPSFRLTSLSRPG